MAGRIEIEGASIWSLEKYRSAKPANYHTTPDFSIPLKWLHHQTGWQ